MEDPLIRGGVILFMFGLVGAGASLISGNPKNARNMIIGLVVVEMGIAVLKLIQMMTGRP